MWKLLLRIYTGDKHVCNYKEYKELNVADEYDNTIAISFVRTCETCGDIKVTTVETANTSSK